MHSKLCQEVISDGDATVQETVLIYLMPLKLLPLQPASKTEINTVATTMKKKKCCSNSYRGLKVPNLFPMPRTVLQALCCSHYTNSVR